MNKQLIIILMIVSTLLVPVSKTIAQATEVFVLNQSSITNGGGIRNGSRYSMNDTLGQLETGAVKGGQYSIISGFLAEPRTDGSMLKAYLPSVMR